MSELVNQPDQAPVPASRDPWYTLAALTPARIALGHVGAGLPTARHLELQLAQARARDAVWRPFEADALESALITAGHDVIRVHSTARNRHEYLGRPDLGRQLMPNDTRLLEERAGDWTLGFVVADGLATLAAERHAPELVRAVCARLDPSWSVAPIVIAEQARVALGDPIGEALGLQMVIVLIGERPGMSAHDSLGAYITWAPRTGRTDAERNCVSNVRPEGLGYEPAADTIAGILRQARLRGHTGVMSIR